MRQPVARNVSRIPKNVHYVNAIFLCFLSFELLFRVYEQFFFRL